MSPDTVARIKACKGVYSVRDTANFFGVSKTTVHEIWMGRRHVGVSPAEPPNIQSTRKLVDTQDVRNLLARGYNITQIAIALGVSRSTIYDRLNAAPVLYVTRGYR